MCCMDIRENLSFHWYGMVWYGMVWYGMVWYGMVWYGMVWYGMAKQDNICSYNLFAVQNQTDIKIDQLALR